jgi:hypothetical protein|tara:strand:+ start:143 stop:280 length:138 start_codon:yes stop_codon:yes gene_type:complete
MNKFIKAMQMLTEIILGAPQKKTRKRGRPKKVRKELVFKSKEGLK